MQRIKNVEAASLSSYIYEQFNETAAWIWTCGEKAEKLDQCPIGTPVFSISHVNAHIHWLGDKLPLDKCQ